MSDKKPLVLYNGELGELQSGDNLLIGGTVSPTLLLPCVVPGHFPNANFPKAYNLSGIVGNNDLYTVPSGRKAIVTDFMTTNQTGLTSTVYPMIWIQGAYYRIGAPLSENNNSFGHNYGFSQTRSAPIVLNAGEKFAVNSSIAGCVFWANITEFDSGSPLSRADIKNWTAGDNTLLTVPPGKTVSIGSPGLTSINQPAYNVNGLSYFNDSGSNRTLNSINIVPSGGSAGSSNAFTTANTVFNGNIFSKYFHGNLGPGDFISMNSDSNASGQFAWCNYLLADISPTGSSLTSVFSDQLTIDFGTADFIPQSIVVSVSDPGIEANSKISAQVIAPASGRDLDEMEMEQFACAAGNILAGVGFDLMITCLTKGAHGQYLVNYSR